MKKCSVCGINSTITIQLGKEKRRLCKKHYTQHMAKDGSYDVIFQKASKYKVEPEE
jgi:hypothetical protein